MRDVDFNVVLKLYDTTIGIRSGIYQLILPIST